MIDKIRVREDDILEAIVSPKKDKLPHTELKEAEVVVYTIKGYHDDMINDLPILYKGTKTRRDKMNGDSDEYYEAANRAEACAKQETHERKDGSRVVKYYIKRGLQGRLFNPMSLYGDIKTHKKRTGQNEFQYFEVNKNAFHLYLKFLQTKNLSFLRNAERSTL